MDKLPKIGNDVPTNKSPSSTGNWADKKPLDFSLGSTNTSLDSVNSGKKRCTRNLFLPNIHIPDSITFSRNAPAMPLIGWMCVCSHVNYPTFSFCAECGYAKSAIINKDHYRSVKRTQFAVNNTAVDHHQENLDSLEREERLSKSTPSFFPPIKGSEISNIERPESSRNEELSDNCVDYNNDGDYGEEKQQQQQQQQLDNNNNKPVVTHAFDNDYVEHKVLLINNNQQQQEEQQEEEEVKQQEEEEEKQQEEEEEKQQEEEEEKQQEEEEKIVKEEEKVVKEEEKVVKEEDYQSPKSVEDEQVENYVNDVLRQSINEMKVEDVESPFDLESSRSEKNENKEEEQQQQQRKEEENDKMKIKGLNDLSPSDSEYEKRVSVSSRRSSKYANFDDHLAFPQQFTSMVTAERPQAIPISLNLNMRPPSPPIKLTQFKLQKPNIKNDNKAEQDRIDEPPPATLLGGLVIKETKTI